MLSPKDRPSGISIIAVLWTLGSIINIVSGLDAIIRDLGLLPYLSDPYMPEWGTFGLPAEIVLNFFVVALSFLILLVVYGLFTAKSWSYDLALAIPVFVAIINIAIMGLYASAPIELELGGEVISRIPLFAVNLLWAVIIWSYLTRPHVKQYLKQLPTPPVPVPPLSTPILVASSEGKKFCRYCGAENKTDADFCEKCGRKIGK